MSKYSLMVFGLLISMASLQAAAPRVVLTSARIAKLQKAFEVEEIARREANRLTWLRTSEVSYLTRCNAVSVEEQQVWEKFIWGQATNIYAVSQLAGCDDLATAFEIYADACKRGDRCQYALKDLVLKLYEEKKQKIMAMAVREAGEFE